MYIPHLGPQVLPLYSNLINSGTLAQNLSSVIVYSRGPSKCGLRNEGVVKGKYIFAEGGLFKKKGAFLKDLEAGPWDSGPVSHC